MSVQIAATGLPLGISIGDLESLVMRLISGRILGLGLRGEGVGEITLASGEDADAVVGEHQLMGAKVTFARISPVSAEAMASGPASSNKRTRSGVGGPSGALPMAGSVIASAPTSCNSTQSTAQASSANGEDGAAGGGAASSSHNAFAEDALMVMNVVSSSFESSSTAATTLAEQTLAEAEEIAAAAAAVTAAAGAAAGNQPNIKRQKSGGSGETKKEKERRLNRVGLSYRCGRCGMPKKGHVCTGVARESEDSDVPLVQGASAAAAAPAGVKTPTNAAGASASQTAGTPGIWDLDSDSIFKDIKSVLQTPAGGAAGGGGSSKAGAGEPKEKKKGGTKKKKGAAAEMPPPPAMPAVVAERAAEKSALLEELDIAMQRPPSVITPEDGAGAAGGPSSLGAPSSLVSASDMFSPGQLMTHLLGTPTPAITPGLSPGTLNELGNMLQSPGAVLASARKVAEAAGSVETPGQ